MKIAGGDLMNVPISTYYIVLNQMQKLGCFTIDALLNSLKYLHIDRAQITYVIDDLICTSAICNHFDYFWVSPKISCFLQIHTPNNHQ